MRLMGLDLGALTLGVALSDPSGTLATGIETIRRDSENKLRETLRRLEQICRDNEVTLIVLGLPLSMDGRISERAEKTLAFAKKLEARLSLPVVMQDERLTSVEAEQIMAEQGLDRKEIKKRVDTLAAEIILQDYLNGKT
ncbi:MAG: Holliday junction resolvase RuvX [Lachnospiraceae bacterium]|nr:Holliday junction resolvase RuvX [Lachnospiraceae bacterium]